jgi:hypothetical protein
MNCHEHRTEHRQITPLFSSGDGSKALAFQRCSAEFRRMSCSRNGEICEVITEVITEVMDGEIWEMLKSFHEKSSHLIWNMGYYGIQLMIKLLWDNLIC